MNSARQIRNLETVPFQKDDYTLMKGWGIQHGHIQSSSRKVVKGFEKLDYSEAWCEIFLNLESSWASVMINKSSEPATIDYGAEQRNKEIAEAFRQICRHSIEYLSKSAQEHQITLLACVALMHDFAHDLRPSSFKDLYSRPFYFKEDFDQSVEQVVIKIESLPPVKQRPEITSTQHPWEMGKSKVEIIEEYDAKIVDDEGEDYAIEFIDYDSSVVEASLPKEEFKDLPYQVGPGSHFWVVVYRIKARPGTTVSVWPVAEYWAES